MEDLLSEVDAVARERRLHGVVDTAGDVVRAYGLADRALRCQHGRHTFTIASGARVHRAGRDEPCRAGSLHLTTRARALLGADLPLVDNDVTIEHLLAHRSGIGD